MPLVTYAGSRFDVDTSTASVIHDAVLAALAAGRTELLHVSDDAGNDVVLTIGAGIPIAVNYRPVDVA